jgi:hypothetical protein
VKTAQSWFKPWMLAAIFLASFASASQARNVLLVGEYISTAAGSNLVSPSGRAMLVVQRDSNACVYAGAPATTASYTNGWCSNKYSNMFQGDRYLTLGNDGNVCVFIGASPANKGNNVWCSGGYGPIGQYYLILDDHGNLCSHKGPNPQNDFGVLWCSMDMTGVPQPAPATVIDVSSTLSNLYNSDANAWKSLAQAVGGNPPELYYIESIKVTQLDNTAFNFTPPSGKLFPVASKEIVNCDTTSVSETVNLIGTINNSYAVSKSKTFDTSVSATVSYSGWVTSGSVTMSAGFSMTDSSTSSTSNTVTASDSQTIGFSDYGGRIAVLQTLRQQGNVAWQASFAPPDTQSVVVTARRVGGNDRSTATLQWNQVKSYLPADKRTIVVSGTLAMDQADSKGSRITTYRMAAADVDAICAQAPPVMQSGYTAMDAPGPGLKPSASSAAAKAPARARRGIVQREVSAQQALAIMNSQQPVH